MSLRINQNIDAFNSYRNLSVTQGQMSKSLGQDTRLGDNGLRIDLCSDVGETDVVRDQRNAQRRTLRVGPGHQHHGWRRRIREMRQ